MAKKKCEQCDGVAAASPRRSIAPTTARPVGFHRAANPASSSSVIRPCFSSKSGGILLFSFTIEYVQERGEWLLIPFNFAVETIAKKKVEDVMPIATGHEKEDLVNVQQEEVKEMQDKVLRTYAEMENLMARTKRNAENDKKFAIQVLLFTLILTCLTLYLNPECICWDCVLLQKFATSLLDVADNLGRASSVVKESFSKLDTSKDSAGATPLLKTLLEGVEMTEKQLAEVI